MTQLEQQLEASLKYVEAKKRNQQMTTAAIEVHKPNGQALAQRLEFTPEQEQMIYNIYAKGASRDEFAVLMEIAKARRLNPLLRQCYFVKRWDSKARVEVWAVQAGIDGIRAVAERTGKYDGQDEPEYEERDGTVLKATVRVYRKDWTRPAVGVAYMSEYVQKTKEGAPTHFWKNMPHIMLAKCAEALALRKAFPEDMSGLYIPEEMAQAENPNAPPKISPYDQDDYNVVAADPPRLMQLIKDAEALMMQGEYVGAREMLGSRAKVITGSAAVEIQKERDAGNITMPYHRELSRHWLRVERQLSKREALPPVDAAASFIDPEDDGREVGA